MTTKAWFRIKWLDEYKLFGFTIETSHSDSKFMLSVNDRDKLIKALQNFDEELLFTVD